MYHTLDTIAAIASAPGGAARGIVRVSGPAAVTVVEACFRPQNSGALGAKNSAAVVNGTLDLGEINVLTVPADVYLWPTRRSYTREPVAEIHTLGAPALLSALLRRLCASGARLAAPGEFTLRAFLAGRLDLTQAEAVLGVIDARGEQDLQFALAQLAGGLARPLHRLRDTLLDLLAQLEAGLDFAEEDIQFITATQIDVQLQEAVAIVAGAAEQLAGRTRRDELPRAVLAGWPNVGKSSLFNALARDGAALVASQGGTTRDYLAATVDLGSIRCQLVDTAGVEPEPGTSVARAAQQLAAVQREHGDVQLFCVEAGRRLNGWERGELAANHLAERLVVVTKCDGPCHVSLSGDAIRTSAATGLGLEALRQALAQTLLRGRGERSGGASAERCGESLRAANDSLARALRLNSAEAGEELIAAEIRLALVELGKVVGAVYTDDILDRIFGRFCIGK